MSKLSVLNCTLPTEDVERVVVIHIAMEIHIYTFIQEEKIIAESRKSPIQIAITI